MNLFWMESMAWLMPQSFATFLRSFSPFSLAMITALIWLRRVSHFQLGLSRPSWAKKCRIWLRVSASAFAVSSSTVQIFLEPRSSGPRTLEPKTSDSETFLGFRVAAMEDAIFATSSRFCSGSWSGRSLFFWGRAPSSLFLATCGAAQIWLGPGAWLGGVRWT